MCFVPGEAKASSLAERVGFEPTVRFPVHSISSAASSATPAPLQGERIFAGSPKAVSRPNSYPVLYSALPFTAHSSCQA